MENDRNDPLIGRVISGTYKPLRQLGRGAFGRVYEARHTKTGGLVALKVLRREACDADMVARFQREAMIMAQLHHPGVAWVTDLGQLSDGRPYMAMELLRGQDLEQALCRDPRPDPARLISILEQTAEALDAAHRAGVVHRDLKPANIYLEGEGGALGERVRVLDFGIARVRSSELTREGGLLGTLKYMAPEQIRGEVRDMDARTDVYALGVIAHRALTGRHPFIADNDARLMQLILSEPPPGLGPGLPAGASAAVCKALAKEMDHRFPGASAFVADLSAALVPPARLDLQVRGQGGGRLAVPLPRAVLGRAASPDRPDVDLGVVAPGGGSVSRLHAEICRVAGGFEVQDLGSLSGTRLNGRDLRPGVSSPLAPGDKLELGGVSLVVKAARR